MFEYVTTTLAIFNISGGGTFSNLYEACERVGKRMEELKLPSQSLQQPAPCCALCWCSTTFTPGRQFLRSCVARLYAAMFLSLLITFVRVMLIDFGHHDAGVAGNFWTGASLYLLIANLLVTVFGIAAQTPLQNLVDPLVMSFMRKLTGLRKIQFTVFFNLYGGLNGVIVLIMVFFMNTPTSDPCPWYANHMNVVVSVELLASVLIGQRSWVPPYNWSPFDSKDYSENQHEARFIEAANAATGSYEKTAKFIAGVASKIQLSDQEVQDLISNKIKPEDVGHADLFGVTNGTSIQVPPIHHALEGPTAPRGQWRRRSHK